MYGQSPLGNIHFRLRLRHMPQDQEAKFGGCDKDRRRRRLGNFTRGSSQISTRNCPLGTIGLHPPGRGPHLVGNGLDRSPGHQQGKQKKGCLKTSEAALRHPGKPRFSRAHSIITCTNRQVGCRSCIFTASNFHRSSKRRREACNPMKKSMHPVKKMWV